MTYSNHSGWIENKIAQAVFFFYCGCWFSYGLHVRFNRLLCSISTVSYVNYKEHCQIIALIDYPGFLYLSLMTTWPLSSEVHLQSATRPRRKSVIANNSFWKGQLHCHLNLDLRLWCWFHDKLHVTSFLDTKIRFPKQKKKKSDKVLQNSQKVVALNVAVSSG